MNLNETPDNITLNPCQYTPVYLIKNNSITQAHSYVIAPPKKEEHRPVTNNLKLFYENSGNIENGLILNNVQYVSNTPVLKQVQEPPGNKLKLASFLVPKKDANKQQYIATISNKILEPIGNTSDTNVFPNISIIRPKMNGARNKAHNAPRTLLKPRILPKITPKEKTSEPTKHTSVQLLKLGGTYHSLNQLSSEQMRLVTKALENIKGEPDRAALKSTYDADSNTRILYKVVSPNDLKLIGKNKIIVKTSAIKKEEPVPKKEEVVKVEAHEDDEEEEEPVAEVKVTRSGRTVKLPRHIQDTQEDPPPKAKKKTTTFSCFTCCMEFASLYRLQRHYDNRPGHIPADVHSNLFHCLLTMTQHSTADDKAAVFIRQLEQLVERLRALLPCLLKEIDGEGTPCNVNDDIGRLFGMDPGVYKLNVDALSCKKDNDGHCIHNPKPIPSPFNTDLSKPSQLWLSKHQEETANSVNEGEDCARINSVDKWAKKRVWKHKLNKTESKQGNNKKVKLNSDSGECLIEPGSEVCDPIIEIRLEKPEPVLKEDKEGEMTVPNESRSLPTLTESPIKTVEAKKQKGTHKQFYSTHFDIRSSPIKPSSAIFSKFQIIPEKIPLKFDAPLLRPLTFEQNDQTEESSVHNSSDSSLDLNGIFKELSPNTENTDIIVSTELADKVSCKESDVLKNISFDNPKEWTLSETSEAQEPNNLIIPAMMHMKDDNIGSTFNDQIIAASFNDKSMSNNDNSVSNNDDLMGDSRLSLEQGVSVLNFLETLGNELTCPETELRNNSMDFPLDLFSFNHA